MFYGSDNTLTIDPLFDLGLFVSATSEIQFDGTKQQAFTMFFRTFEFSETPLVNQKEKYGLSVSQQIGIYARISPFNFFPAVSEAVQLHSKNGPLLNDRTMTNFYWKPCNSRTTLKSSLRGTPVDKCYFNATGSRTTKGQNVAYTSRYPQAPLCLYKRL